MSDHPVVVRRAYEEPLATDGTRVLVDRIWPRGLTKERAHLDEWCKSVAPSSALRTWYAHVPERFEEFTTRYRAELEEPERAAAFQHLRELVKGRPPHAAHRDEATRNQRSRSSDPAPQQLTRVAAPAILGTARVAEA